MQWLIWIHNENQRKLLDQERTFLVQFGFNALLDYSCYFPHGLYSPAAWIWSPPLLFRSTFRVSCVHFFLEICSLKLYKKKQQKIIGCSTTNFPKRYSLWFANGRILIWSNVRVLLKTLHQYFAFRTIN